MMTRLPEVLLELRLSLSMPGDTELNSSSEMSEKRRHLFRAAQLRIFFYSLRSEKEFDDPNSFSKWYEMRLMSWVQELGYSAF